MPDFAQRPGLPPEPLDLASQAVFRSFRGSANDPALLTFLMSMDRLDLWAVDHDARPEPALEVRLFLEDLKGSLLRNADALDSVPVELTRLLANLTTSRCMYLLRYIGDCNERFIDALGDVLEMAAPDDAEVACVARRLQTFVRGRLLAEVFAGHRLSRIVRIMGGMA